MGADLPSSYDGAALGSQYDSPAHRGPLPETKEDEKVYTGSCHCGGVTVAVASVPLDATILGSNVKGRGGVSGPTFLTLLG